MKPNILLLGCVAFGSTWMLVNFYLVWTLSKAGDRSSFDDVHHPMHNTTEIQIPNIIHLDRKDLTPLRDVDRSSYTVRINTWERPEQLVVSVNHHSKCHGAAQIQVVWCQDQKGDPPQEILENPKVVIERHTVNSLNERFNILTPTPTLGILSIDDDVLRPCEAIDSGFFKWTINPDRMVGFDARLHEEREDTWAYGYLSTTEKANRYSISLTRYCFLHRDYLNWYTTAMPRPIFHKVAKHFNCEDIAMTLYISSLTDGRPPLLADQWAIKSMLKLYSKSAISSTDNHKKMRDECVDSFAEQFGLKDGELKRLETAEIVRQEFKNFECGAKSNPIRNMEERSVTNPRQKRLSDKIEHWKQLDQKELSKEIQKMWYSIAKEPYVRGLLVKTDPWKKKFGTS